LQELYGSILYIKDLKKLLAYSSLAHVGLIAAGTYTLLDGLRGAVLQMIAHGFVVVGLFSSLTSFLDDMKHELSLKWVVYTITTICFDVLTFSISFSCSSYYFQLCWSLRSYTAYAN
jgi:NADH:ubiquinone oxidoreductase subunit 4 (subunit M)